MGDVGVQLALGLGQRAAVGAFRLFGGSRRRGGRFGLRRSVRGSLLCRRRGGRGGSLTGRAIVRTLSSEDAHTCNTFENPTAVTPIERTIDFADGDALILPAASVTGVVITPIAL